MDFWEFDGIWLRGTAEFATLLPRSITHVERTIVSHIMNLSCSSRSVSNDVKSKSNWIKSQDSDGGNRKIAAPASSS
jgi:hypothetical protein